MGRREKYRITDREQKIWDDKKADWNTKTLWTVEIYKKIDLVGVVCYSIFGTIIISTPIVITQEPKLILLPVLIIAAVLIISISLIGSWYKVKEDLESKEDAIRYAEGIVNILK